MTPPERRLDYRLRYPIFLRPTLTSDAAVIPVADISQSGLRLACYSAPLRAGDPFNGRVSFPLGKAVNVAGTVLRVADDHVAVQLQQGFSFNKILAEYQRIQGQSQ